MDSPNVARPGATCSPHQPVQPGNSPWKGGLDSNAMDVHMEHLKSLNVPMTTSKFNPLPDPGPKQLHIDLET